MRSLSLTESDTMGDCAQNVAELLKDQLKRWRGKRYQKEAANDLNIPLPTYRKYENGKRTPNKLALAELERRMNANGHV